MARHDVPDEVASTLPASTPTTRPERLIAVGQLVGGPRRAPALDRLVGLVRDPPKRAEQLGGHPDRAGIAQGRTGLALTLDFAGALRAQREVVRRTQMGVHSQLTVDERSDRLGG